MEWLCLRLHNLNERFRLFDSRLFMFSCKNLFDWIPSFIKNCKYFSCWLYFRKLHRIGLIHETLAILCDSFIIPSFYKLLHWIELKGYYKIRILWKVYFLIIIFCSYYLEEDTVIWSFKTFPTKSIKTCLFYLRVVVNVYSRFLEAKHLVHFPPFAEKQRVKKQPWARELYYFVPLTRHL